MSGKSKIKPLTAFIDYCCFNLSIVIARLQINVGNVNEQWSTVTLISKLNSLPYTDSANFYVNSIALSHGLLIFQKTLKYFGLDTVQIFQEEKSVPEYDDQPFSRMSIEFRCSAFTTPMVDAKDLLTRILSVHNLILKKLNYEVSLSVSPSEAFGVLFLHMAVSDIPKKDESPEKVIESYNLRKSPNSLTQRSITNVSKKIISSVEEKVGVENSFFFLKSAVKVLHKKRKWDIESESDNGVEEDDDDDNDEDDSFENRTILGEAVQSAVKCEKKKKVQWSSSSVKILLSKICEGEWGSDFFFFYKAGNAMVNSTR